MRVFFATNRESIGEPITDFGPNFSRSGLADLRFGYADVDNGKYSLTVAPENLTPSDEEESIFGSQKVFEDLKAQMAGSKSDTVLMIHGYATTFEASILGAAKFKAAYESQNFNVVMFSWPSDGRNFPQDYGNDRHDAQASSMAFARGILKLIRFLQDIPKGEGCGQKIHLLAHSMGNYVLRNALQEIKRQVGVLPCVFENIFLMAADEDDDAMELPEKFFDLPGLTKKLHIYFNHSDEALAVSHMTKGNPERLGHMGPRNPRATQHKVSLIDVSRTMGLDVDSLVGHGYYDSNKYVIADVLQVFQGKDGNEVDGRTYLADKNCFKLCA